MTPHDDLATLREFIDHNTHPWLAHPTEADAALSRVETELARLEARWQELEHPFDKSEYDAMYERMVAAEAEVARLREGLRKLANPLHIPKSEEAALLSAEVEGIARSLLADNQEASA